MKKKTRTILFFSLFFAFVLSAPAIILYSQGYRFDFEKRKITQTGAIFLRVEPKQAEIYINDKLVKKTDFFFGSALLENLLPGGYKIKVKKEGYYLWEKNLEVKKKQVTEAKNIILTQGKINFTALIKNIEDFWVAPDGKKIILMENEKNNWALKLYDLGKNVKSQLIGEEDISQKFPADFISLAWSADSKEIYLNAAIKENEQNFTLKLDKLPIALIRRGATSTPILNIPGSFPIKAETEYKLDAFNNYTFLREGETLYLFSNNQEIFEKILEGVKNIKISPNKDKLTIFSSSEIWIFYLKDIMGQPAKKAGEKQFLSRLSEKIGDVFWLDNDYLAFNSGNNIKISETDSRDRIQTWDISSFPAPKIFFNSADKKLYILSGKNLYVGQIF